MTKKLLLIIRLDSLNISGGFWTPASSMGNKLLARLSKNAGIKFEIQKKLLEKLQKDLIKLKIKKSNNKLRKKIKKVKKP